MVRLILQCLSYDLSCRLSLSRSRCDYRKSLLQLLTKFSERTQPNLVFRTCGCNRFHSRTFTSSVRRSAVFRDNRGVLGSCKLCVYVTLSLPFWWRHYSISVEDVLLFNSGCKSIYVSCPKTCFTECWIHVIQAYAYAFRITYIGDTGSFYMTMYNNPGVYGAPGPSPQLNTLEAGNTPHRWALEQESDPSGGFRYW